MIGNYGMIATGNHGDFDSLRGAPRPYGVRGDGGRLIIAPTFGRLIIAPTFGRLIIAPTGCGVTAGGMHECIPYEGNFRRRLFWTLH